MFDNKPQLEVRRSLMPVSASDETPVTLLFSAYLQEQIHFAVVNVCAWEFLYQPHNYV